MIPTLVALGIVSAIELLMWVGPVWQIRKALSCLLIIVISILSGLLIAGHLSGWTLLLLVISGYRVINLLRILEGRMHSDYLLSATRRSSLWLIGLQVLVLLSLVVNRQLLLPPLTWWYILATIQLVVAVSLLATTLRSLRTTRPPILQSGYADRDLPSLTVAIPARNETEDLDACLQSLVASNYPKLEILVLDDCSQNKQTPEIIKAFAHDGVRFISGQAPPDEWLAKNYAYHQLTEASSGELLLFCGVDVKFEPDSLSQLVKILLEKKKQMLCVLPKNQLPSKGWPMSRIVQASRYAWELSLPRRALNRPPVLSTCWLITRKTLQAAGGFAGVRHGVLQERYFARHALAHDDGYSFVCADATIGISCNKQLAEQTATAVRIRYPQLHRRLELVLLVSLAEFTILAWPVVIGIVAVITQTWGLAAIAGLTSVAATTFYQLIVDLAYRKRLPSAFLLLPLAALYDIGLLNYSMWMYEFKEVIWKGRNVCVPVMRVIPHLPRL